MTQKRALSHAISLAVNYRLFSHGDVSYRFNGKNDKVVLELLLKLSTDFFPGSTSSAIVSLHLHHENKSV